MNIPRNVSDAAKVSQLRTGIFASVSIAQWALESGWGAHTPGNNPFGMKPRRGKNDPQQMLWTTEYSKTRGYYKVQQPFRLFKDLNEAFVAHAELISTAPVYAGAMAEIKNGVDAFVRKLAVRYATDPRYADKVLSIIKQNTLTRFDV